MPKVIKPYHGVFLVGACQPRLSSYTKFVPTVTFVKSNRLSRRKSNISLRVSCHRTPLMK